MNLLADEFVVQSFNSVISDLSARTYPKKDVNDEFCAIIKVSTDLTGLTFYSNQLEDIVKNQYDYWLYVSPGTRYIEISKQNFIKLPYEVPLNLESSKVYTMVLTNKDKKGISATENTVQLTFKLNESNVYISRGNLAPLETRGKNASFKLPPGQYTFTFTKNGFNDLTKTVALNKDEIVNISLQPGQSTSKLKLPGIVLISSEPTGAEVFINDQKVGQTPYTDQLIAGNYSLSIRKKLYHTSNSTLELGEGESVTVPTISLKPKFAYIAVNTAPSQAKIYLDNKLLGESPIARQKIESGNHSVRIEKDLYHTEEQNILFNDGDDKPLTYDLKPAFGELIINSVPTGAELSIDGNVVGLTPYNNPKQPSRTYNVKVSKNMWYPVEEEIIVSDGKKVEKTLILSQNSGTFTITAEGADIFVNDEKVGKGTFTQKSYPGKYSLKATKPKHRDATKEIFLKIGDNQEITLTPEPILASVSIISQPTMETMGARIFVNNKVIPDKTTPAVLPLLIGDYNITLKHKGYLDLSKPVTLSEGDQKKITFNMQTYSGSMLQKENAWKRNKRFSFAASVLIAGAGIYCNYMGDQAYDDFQTAKTTNGADNAWDKCNNMYGFRDISYSVSVAPLVFGVYSWIKQDKYQKLRYEVTME